MEPVDLLRLFVLRPPEPRGVVNPDRIGASPVVAELTRLLEQLDPKALLDGLEKLDRDTRLPEKSILLRPNGTPKLSAPDGAEASESNAETVPATLDGIKEVVSGKDGKKADEAALAALHRQLVQIRDRWLLDRVLESRLVERLGGKGHPLKPRAEREQLEIALKVATAGLLCAEQPETSKERIRSMLSSPIPMSSRIAQAMALRQSGEKQARLVRGKDALQSLRERRDNLRALRRVSLDLLDEMNAPASAQDTQLPRPKLLSLVVPERLRAPRINRGLAAEAKPISAAEFVKALHERLQDGSKLELRALANNLKPAGTSNLDNIFMRLEDDICGVTLQIARLRPAATSYVVRALTAAYARPQVPVHPVGFIELMRVTEELVDYSAREIAHIENKAGGETRERTHTYSESNQNIVATEQFEETEETRDLQTTQRNELQSQASKVIEQEFSVNAGLNVSASYGVGVGTSVQLDASLSVGYRSAVTTSQQTASNISREIVAKTVSRVRQNQRRSQTATILRTMEEQNRHEYKVAANRMDSYVWVEKIEELKLKAYGKRLVLEFIVPEPALPLALRYANGAGLAAPEEFRLSPQEITEDNYGELKQTYGATGIAPPPPEFLMIGKGNARKFDSNAWVRFYAHELAMKIPANYVPYKVFVNAQVHGWADVFVAFAGRSVYKKTLVYDTREQSIDATHVLSPLIEMAETGQQEDGLSLTILLAGNTTGYGFWEGTVNAAVLCRRSCRALEQWQLDTHDRLYAAYRARMAEYEEKRAANPMSATVGGPAAANREAELECIKKAAIYILKGEPVFHDLFSEGDGGTPSTSFSIPGLQQLREDLNFFEDAFEWRQSTFSLYMGFWGNEARSIERKRFQTADPKHEAFLAAGAARVLLPVVPGREREVLTYLAGRFSAAYADLGTDGVFPGPEVVYSEIWAELPPEPDATRPDTWRNSLVATREDLVFGQGAVKVTQGSPSAQLTASNFDPMLDLGREIWIEGRQHFVIKIDDAAGTSFKLDANFTGHTDPNAPFLIGARTIGAPWRVRVPTSLVVLKEFAAQLTV
jgi:hypothetical protein